MQIGYIRDVGSYQHATLWEVDRIKFMREVALGMLPRWHSVARLADRSHSCTYLVSQYWFYTNHYAPSIFFKISMTVDLRRKSDVRYVIFVDIIP